MAQNLSSDCGSEPACKRLKTDLELTFGSHLELTNQLAELDSSVSASTGPLLLTTSELSLHDSDGPENPTSNNNMAIDTTSTVSLEVPNDELPSSVIDEVIAGVTTSIKESENGTVDQLPDHLKGENEDSETETETEAEAEIKSGKSLKENTVSEPVPDTIDDTVESQESGSDEVEVIQAKIKKKKTKTANQRKEIRKILSADQLEEDTLAAQREEAERLQRQRLLQRQQSLHRPAQPWQFSVDDVVKRMANKGITMTLSSESPFPGSSSSNIGEIDIKKTSAPEETEQEVFTLSSDDEEINFVPQESVNYNSFAPFSKNFYSGGVIRNSGGGLVVAKSELSETPLAGNQLQEVDKGAESDSSDCVVISPPPMDEVDDTTEKYDDENNVPDELGRVLINVGHPAEDPDIFLSPRIAKAVKPHQIGGIRFLYDNVVESMERFNSTGGLGCILAHSMGLGKTIQAAAFCDVMLRYTPANTILVIVPINTVQNWLNEFNQWLPQAKKVDPVVTTHTRKYVRRKNKPKKTNEQSEVNEKCQETDKSQGEDLPDELKCNESMSAATSTSGIISEEQSLSESNLSSEVSTLLEPPSSESVPTPTPVNHSGGADSEEPAEGRTFSVYVLNETVKTLAARERIITDWSENRGVLLIGYEMYRMLALRKLKKSTKKDKTKMCSPEEEKARILKANHEDTMLTKIYSCLVRPGPDLVICDEGHRIKNSGASISQALKAIKTRRRVVLTGYPLQNNLMEYWCMVDFIRPSYLGSKTEFSNMFERPITNGQCADSTAGDKRLMQYRSHVLHSLLEGFVQRRSHVVLQKALPAKQEWVFLLKMTPIQYHLYKEFINYIRLLGETGSSTPNPIKAFAVCCKIWNHPDVLYNVVKKKQSILDDFEGLTEEVEGSKLRKSGNQRSSKISSDLNDNSFYMNNSLLQGEDLDPDSFPIFTNYGCIPSGSNGGVSRENRTTDNLLSLEWASGAFNNYVPGNLENGTKFELLFLIIEECLKVNDRLLVFSQSLLTLDLMETFLGLKLNWMKNRDYFRLDGSTGGLERERLINDFNSSSTSAHVFLVSTRAGSLGINLIGANRVVVFDASWNPCHDCQAVCRVYRYGQKKECQIYRFVTDCTLEKRIYDRQINKRGMANRVVDEMNPDSHFNSKDMSSTLHLELHDLDRVQEATCEQDPTKYEDIIMQNVLTKAGDKITKEPFEHESLLIDRKEKKLSASERRMAHRNYEFEKKAATNSTTPPNTSTRQQPHSSFYPGYQGMGMQMPKTGVSGMNGMDYGRSGADSYMYGRGGPIGGSYDKQTPSVQPIPQHVEFDYDREEMLEANKRKSREALPLPIEELKKRGVSVQGIVLRKDSYLADPEGGSDIFLRQGDKVYLLRSDKGSYLRLSNGRIIALRRRARSNYLDQIPPTQELTKEQILHVINSIFKPRTSSSSSYPHRHEHRPPPPPPPTHHQSTRSEMRDPAFTNGMSQSQFPYHHSMSVPLPPSHPYGDFLNQQNLQITNQRSSSGGDVTIWKQDAQPNQIKSRKSQDDLIPDIEVIKLNPTDNTLGKTRTKLSPRFPLDLVGQPLPKSMPLIQNQFSRSPVAHSDYAYPPSSVPETRKNPAVVDALLSGQWRPTVQKSLQESESHQSFDQIIQRSQNSSIPLHSELTIQPIPIRPNQPGMSDYHPNPLRNFNSHLSWLPGSSSSRLPPAKTQFQNFSHLPNSVFPEDGYDRDGYGTDFVETGQELLSELTNPRLDYTSNYNRSVGPSQEFQKSGLFPNPLNSFLGRRISDTVLPSNSERYFLDPEQMLENGLRGNDNSFSENIFSNNSANSTSNLNSFGQYFSRNHRVSTAEGSQSFSPQS